MRWQVILQAAVGVGALYGFAYLAVERKIAPLEERAALHRGSAEARVAALEVERAWCRSRDGLKTAARALVKSPVIATLGQTLPAARRAEGLEAAVTSAVDQIGGDGLAALLGPESEVLAGAAALGGTGPARTARGGAVGLQVEILGEVPHEVVAVPLAESGGESAGVLVLARPLTALRLASWTGGLPASTAVVILDGTEPLVSLRRLDRLEAVRPERLPSEVEIGEDRFAVSEVRLPSDTGGDLRVVALAPTTGAQDTAIADTVRLLVVGLAGLGFLLTVALLLANPPPPAAPASASGYEPNIDLAGRSGEHPASTPPASEGAFSARRGAPSPGLTSASLPAVRRDPPSSSEPARSPVAAAASPFATAGEPASASSRASASDADLFGGLGASPSRVGTRPNASGTYSGVPAAVADTLPGSAPDLDASPHSSGAFDPVPDMPREDPLPSGGGPRVSAGKGARASGSWSAAPYARRPSSDLDASPDPLGLGGAAGFRPDPPAKPEGQPARAQPPAPPPASNEIAAMAPSFDAIARAARTAPPSAAPAAGRDENLPAPKGGLSPGMVAGQGIVAQGRVMAPSPRLEGNLPIPKEQASHLYDLAPDASGTVPAPASRTGPRGSPGLASSISTGLSSPHLNAVSAPPGTTGDLAVPFDTAHYRRVYDEFVAAKTRIGESVEGLTFEGFGAKLRASEEGLLQQHGCRAVRFQVLVKDRSVSLRPQLVR